MNYTSIILIIAMVAIFYFLLILFNYIICYWNTFYNFDKF